MLTIINMHQFVFFVSIFKWQQYCYHIVKILKTNSPTTCITFMFSGIIFTTKNYYKIEIENFSCKSNFFFFF